MFVQPEASVLCVLNFFFISIFIIYLFLGYIYLHVSLYIVCVSY